MPKEKKINLTAKVESPEYIELKKYLDVFEQLKSDILQSQLRASLSVTKELTLLYWRTGKMLSYLISREGRGTKILERLSRDLKNEFPDVSGFSSRNLWYMKKFASFYPDGITAAAAAVIPWGHNMLMLDRIDNPEERAWYIQKIIENGWSRSILETWIDGKLYKRQGKALNNFKNTLPSPQSDLAEQTVKDPYNLSFLSLEGKYREKKIEQGIILNTANSHKTPRKRSFNWLIIKWLHIFKAIHPLGEGAII